nr:hypothetical protein [Halomonas sp.]
MELTALQQLVHQMYIAYYQRPADPDGLQYWVDQLEQNGDWTAVSAAFGAPENEENQALYGDLNREQTIAAIYQSAFNREAVAEEVAFWAASEFSATDLTFAIVNGAQNSDKATVDNKVAFSAELVAQVGTNAAYAELQDPKALLTAVTEETEVTAGYVSDAVASGKVGEAFSLTADDAGDIFVGTANNDTFTAESGALNATSIDGLGGNDTLNATYKTADDAITPTIRNVENINVTLDVFNGANGTFDATNVRGATITLGSDKLGYNGVAEVEGAAANNVTAGTNVETLSVSGLTTGTVDAGTAETVNVSGSADDAANVVVNGDVALDVATATELALEGTAESTVTLTSGELTDVVVTGEGVTLSVDAGEVSGDTITGAASVEVTSGASTDLTGVDASILLDDDFSGSTIDVADGATLTFGEAQTGTVSVSGDSDNTRNSVTISTAFDVSTLNVSDAGLTTTIEATDDITIGTLTASGSDGVVFTGEGSVTASGNAASIDASELTGELTYTSTATVDIVGGTANNDITVADADTSFTGQGGDDTIDATGFSGDFTLAITAGAGDDTLELDVANGDSGSIAFDGGEGSDTVALASGSDTTGADSELTLANVETIELGGNVTVDGSLLSGEEFTISSADSTADTLSISVDEATTDLSNLTLDDVTVEVTGTSGADTIVGTNGNDVITGSGGADILTGGDGDDTFVFASGDTSASNVASIQDFNLGDFDSLDLDASGGADAISGSGTNVSGADADGVATDIIANYVNGVITLSGDDAGAIDTLAEWVDVFDTIASGSAAEVGAFEFGGNTYVVEASGGSVNNVIELADLTGIQSIDDSAGSNTLVIA